MKLFLIDGTFELFRAFYGAPQARGAQGDEVGAARALLRSLLSLLRQPEATHVACAFDHVIESFRNQLFAGYKTGDGIDPALRAQFPLAEEVSRALGITTWPMIDFEADDALATAAARFSESADLEQVLLCSPDKDLAQCVRGQRVVCLDRIRGQILDEDGVRAKFGVPPTAIADFLALTGDSADGIPGVPRWGPKSAAALLAHYGSLEAIPADPAAWAVTPRGAAALAQSLAEHQDAVRLYKQLATLRTDVPLTEPLEALRWRGARRTELGALCERLGDLTLLDRLKVPAWLP